MQLALAGSRIRSFYSRNLHLYKQKKTASVEDGNPSLCKLLLEEIVVEQLPSPPL